MLSGEHGTGRVEMLAENVTLTHLVTNGLLSNQKRYLRMALANALCAGEFGAVSLRIGREGDVVWPSYVLEAVPGGSMIARYDGQTHKAWSGGEKHNESSWSKATMSGAELHQLWHQVTFDA